MSAFIVSERTMQRAVSALHNRELSCEDADQLGRDLYDLNRRAVQCRYPNLPADELPGSVIPEEWTWRVTMPLHNGNGIPEDRKLACDWLKALHCLRYQLTEGDEVPGTLLYARIEGRIGQIENYLATSLPEYQAAAWDN